MKSRAFVLSLLCALLAFGLVGSARAEELSFLGIYEDTRVGIEFKFKFKATRSDPKANYTVIGEIGAADSPYQLSGTLYAKSGKLRGFVRRKALGKQRAFEQPIDGQLQPGGDKMSVSCLLLSPKTKHPMEVKFVVHKTKDTREVEATIKTWVLDSVKGVPNAEMSVDHLKGVIIVRNRDQSGKTVDRTIRFTPLPPAFADGGKWEFAIEAGSIPVDEYCPLKIQLSYLTRSHKNQSGQPDPIVTFDLRQGLRHFGRTITWDIGSANGNNGVSFSYGSNGGPFVLYRLKTLKRSEFDALTAQYNQTPGTGGTPTATASGLGGPIPGRTTTANPPNPPNPPSPPRTSPISLRTMGIKGDVEIRRRTGKDYEPLRPDSILEAGTLISVAPESSATLQLPNGATLILHGGTELNIDELTSTGGQAATTVRIRMGEITFRHLNRDQVYRGTFIIRAAECVTSTRGTEFSMKFDPKTNFVHIRLTDGKLEFDPGRGLDKMLLDAPTTITWKAEGG